MTALLRLCSVLATICRIYSFILLIRVCLTWVIRDPYLWQQNSLIKVLCKISDPFLNLFRPKNRARMVRVDFSPIIAFMVLSALETTFSLIAANGHITIWLFIAVLLWTFWEYIVRYLLLVITIGCGIRLVLSWSINPRTVAFRNVLDRMLNKPVCFVWNIFCPKKAFDDRKMIILAFVFWLFVFLILRASVTGLVGFLAAL